MIIISLYSFPYYDQIEGQYFIQQYICLFSNQMGAEVRGQDFRVNLAQNQFDQTEGDDNKECAINEQDLNTKLLSKEEVTKIKSLIQKKKSCREDFYKMQHAHELGGQEEVKKIYIYVSQQTLYKKWIPHIINAFKSINDAVPGLQLIRGSQQNSVIYICDMHKKFPNLSKDYHSQVAAWCLGNILSLAKPQPTQGIHSQNNSEQFLDRYVVINLPKKYEKNRMERSSLHQIIHALGFHHEHQRQDRDDYVTVDTSNLKSEGQINQYKKEYIGLTPYDPYSILHYSEDDELKKNKLNQIWKIFKIEDNIKKLSELDKIGLNLLYRPCRRPKIYQPFYNLDSPLKMIYCGRNVMNDHNNPGESLTDGKCGPNNGPNCPSCRVLSNKYEQFQSKVGKSHWQGSSGHVYCGKKDVKQFKQHDGICGPNNGPSCTSCNNLFAYQFTNIKQSREYI